MKTKWLSLLLAAALAVSLSACSPSDSGTSDLSQSASGGTSSGSAAAPQQSLGEFRTDATLEETVMLDEGGVKITATGLIYSSYAAELDLTIENNSGKDLSFISGSMGYSCNSVNGFMVDDGYLNCDVANGKKANGTIRFSYDSLMLYGIDEIADLEIGFDMSDDDYNHTYSGPIQLKTSAYETHDYSTDHYQETITSGAAMSTYGYEMLRFSQDPLYDRNGVKLLSSGVMKNSDGSTALLLELQNTTDSMVYVSASDIAINGLTVEPSTWSSDAVNPGKCRIVDVQLSSVLDPETWDVYGIGEVGSVSVTLGQKNGEGREIAPKTSIEIVVPGVNAGYDATGTEIYNKDGLRIIAKAVMEDSADFSDEMYMYLLAENQSGKTLTIGDQYGSLSVNGYMTDYMGFSQELEDGESAVLSVWLWGDSLEKNQITSPEEIQEIEFTLEVKDGYTTVDESKLTIQYGK